MCCIKHIFLLSIHNINWGPLKGLRLEYNAEWVAMGLLFEKTLTLLLSVVLLFQQEDPFSPQHVGQAYRIKGGNIHRHDQYTYAYVLINIYQMSKLECT